MEQNQQMIKYINETVELLKKIFLTIFFGSSS